MVGCASLTHPTRTLQSLWASVSRIASRAALRIRNNPVWLGLRCSDAPVCGPGQAHRGVEDSALATQNLPLGVGLRRTLPWIIEPVPGGITFERAALLTASEPTVELSDPWLNHDGTFFSGLI
jgi:hypothetical protein